MADQQSVAVVVNDQPITDLDVDNRMDLVIKSSGLSRDQKTLKLVRGRVLNMLIDEKLIAIEAEDKEIKIDDADLTFAMNSIAERNGVQIMQLDTFLKSKGINKAVLEEQIKSQLLLNKYIRVILQSRVSISDVEVEESRSSLIVSYAKSKTEISQVKLAEIVLYYEEGQNDVSALANKLVSEIRRGANFSSLAEEFSESSTATSGGVIGWVYIDQIMPQLSNAIKNIETGGVSEPVRMKDGVHILKVLDIKYKKSASSGTEQINDKQIKEMLLNKKLDLQVKNLMRKLRRNGYISFKD
jgi:peptidyl-prolyl cis-trans isomerase SurA